MKIRAWLLERKRRSTAGGKVVWVGGAWLYVQHPLVACDGEHRGSEAGRVKQVGFVAVGHGFIVDTHWWHATVGEGVRSRE